MQNHKPEYKRRLFLDLDSLTQWDHHLVQRYPQAEKVAISGLEPGSTGPWDAAFTTCFGTVIREDSGLFRIWYYGNAIPDDYNVNVDKPLICYAESDDGIAWRKPSLGLVGQKRYSGNNLLPLPGAPCGVVKALPGADYQYLACTFVYADPPEPDIHDAPSILDALQHGAGTYLWTSNDGLHWRFLKRLFVHGDNACLFADHVTGRYLLYQKVGGVRGMTQRRKWMGIESRDGLHWEGYQGGRQWRQTFECDDFDDLLAQQKGFLHAETYNIGIHRAGELLISTEAIFDVSPPVLQCFRQNPAGLAHMRIGFSKDGFSWQYPKGRPEWISRGKPGEQDAGWLMGSSSLVESGDDLYFYYGGMKYDHDWCINTDFSLRTDIPLSEHAGSTAIMLAKMKRDRFGSLAAVWKGTFDVDADYRLGKKLFINAQATNGQVRVAIAEKRGPYQHAWRKHEHLPGFSFDDCIPLTGDAVRMPVQFRNASIESIPRDLPITLRFELSSAEIFAYEWSD